MDARCPTCRANVPEAAPRGTALAVARKERQGAGTFPFCCERCRLLDLGSWLDERYRVGGSAEEDTRSLPSDDES
ncbi:MAG: DNA gyrase inhibitor YacG [Myxococcales bacterium]|nr:DNA gyrase inhibitor YacG [Myxococcales bacterium]